MTSDLLDLNHYYKNRKKNVTRLLDKDNYFLLYEIKDINKILEVPVSKMSMRVKND